VSTACGRPSVPPSAPTCHGNAPTPSPPPATTPMQPDRKTLYQPSPIHRNRAPGADRAAAAQRLRRVSPSTAAGPVIGSAQAGNRRRLIRPAIVRAAAGIRPTTPSRDPWPSWLRPPQPKTGTSMPPEVSERTIFRPAAAPTRRSRVRMARWRQGRSAGSAASCADQQAPMRSTAVSSIGGEMVARQQASPAWKRRSRGGSERSKSGPVNSS
jgi:hypothetical protein